MLKHWLTKKKLSLICLTASLVGCQNFPVLHPHLISISDNKCVEYDCSSTMPNSCDISCTIKQEWPLSHCDNYTALPPEDIAALKAYQASVCTQAQ